MGIIQWVSLVLLRAHEGRFLVSLYIVRREWISSRIVGKVIALSSGKINNLFCKKPPKKLSYWLDLDISLRRVDPQWRPDGVAFGLKHRRQQDILTTRPIQTIGNQWLTEKWMARKLKDLHPIFLFTTLQSMMNTNVHQEKVWPFHENRLIMRIQMIPQQPICESQVGFPLLLAYPGLT